MRRTPSAIIGKVKKPLQIAGLASGQQDPPAPARGQKGEEASQTDRNFQADAAEMEARARWVEQEPDFIPIMYFCGRPLPSLVLRTLTDLLKQVINEIVERLWLDPAKFRRSEHPQAAIGRLERNVDPFCDSGRGLDQLRRPS